MLREFLIDNWPYLVILLGFLGYVLYLIFTRNWPGLRTFAYMIMLRAEKVYKSKGGEEKLNLVLDKIYEKYPLIDLLMDKGTLKQKLQDWYDIAKDQMDDGEQNGSIHPPGK
jgi:hypothetical protein